MRIVLLILLVLITGVSFAQPSTGYTRQYGGYDFQRIFTRALNIPSGTTHTFQTGQWPAAGALVYDSVGADSGLYYSGVNQVFHKVAKSSDLSSGALISNLGSAYRLWKPQTPGLASLNIDNGLTPDSATSGQIGIKWGGALTANTTISGSNVRDVTFSGLDDYTMTLDRNYFITNTKSDVVAKFEFHGPESGNVISLLQQTTSGDSAAYLNANEYSIGISARQTNPVNEASLIDVFPTYINFQQNGAEGGEYRFHNMQTRYDTTGGWLPLMWRHSDTTIAKLNFWPGGGLSGSIADDQVAVGNGTAISGSSFLTVPSGVKLQVDGTSTGGTDTYFQVSDGGSDIFTVSDIASNGIWSATLNQQSGSNGPYYDLRTAGTLKGSFGVFSGDVYFYTTGAGTDFIIGGDASSVMNIQIGRSSNETIVLNTTSRSESHILYKDISAPSTPASGYGALYTNTDRIYFKNDGGTVYEMTTYGTYNPSLTGVTNVTLSSASSGVMYRRTGDFVTVDGELEVDPTGAGAVELGISLPIASNLVGGNDLGGLGNSAQVTGEGAAIEADGTNNRAALKFTATNTGTRFYKFTFTYKVL